MYYIQSSHVETSPVGDRVVLYDNVSRKAVVLNPTGAWLWVQLSTRSSPDELTDKLQTRFASVPREQLQADVEACLRDLSHQNLLHEEA